MFILCRIYKEVNGNRNNMKHTQGKNPKEPEKQQNKRPVPMIYACATVWHETSIEMVQLLKSIYRYLKLILVTERLLIK